MAKETFLKTWLIGLVVALIIAPIVAFLSIYFCPDAEAAGLNPIGGVGARSRGMGGAGIAAADDASAFYYNPALLGESGSFVQVGGDFMETSFAVKNVFGTKYGAKNSEYFIPLFGINYRINPRMTVGLGVITPNMLGSDFRDSMGFYSKMSLTQIAPTVSYKITDTLTLGAALKAGRGQMELDIPVFVGQFAPNQPVSIIRLDSEADGWGYSGQIGVLWKATPWLNLGAMYQSKTRVSLSGTSDIYHTISGSMGKDNFSTTLYFPGYYGVGGSITLGNLLVALDVIRSDYSSTDKSPMNYNTWPNSAWPDSAITLNWKNNTTLSMGVEYKLSNWRLRAGASYQNGVVPDGTINPATPDLNDAYTASLGFGYAGKKIGFDVAYVHAWGPERTVQGPLLNKYSAQINTISFGITYRF